MAEGDNPNIPSTRPLLRSVKALSSPERQNLAGAGASGDSNPITSPAMHETSAPQAAPWRSMSYAAEQRAGPSNPPSCNLPSGCMQAVPISIIVFHRRLAGRGSRPQIPVSRGCTPAPALPDVLEDGASIQLAGSNFLSLGRESNTAASHTVMNPSQSSIPDTCNYEHALRPNFLEDEASKTRNEAETTRLQQSETTNYCDSHATLESVVPENNLEVQVQHSQESTVLVAEGSYDDNMYMYQPLWKRSKAQIKQSEYPPLSSPGVLKERTLTQIEMQISSAKKPETFRNEESPAQQLRTHRKKHRPKVIPDDKKDKVQKTVDSTPDGKSPQPKVKRSYVRKKRNVSPEKCSGLVSDQSISGGTRVVARRTASVRRSLQFGHEEQKVQGDHMLTANSQQQHHNIEKLIHAESSFCSVTESEVQVGHGPQVDMEMIVAERSKKDLELNQFPCSGRSLLDMDSTSQMSKVSTLENHTHHTNDESSGTGERDSIILRTASKMLAFCRVGGIKKKRSSRIRRNSFVSIMGLQNNTSQASTILPQQCMDALDESCYIKFITNKRSQKVSPQCSSTIEHNLELKNRLSAGSIFYDEYNGPKISEDKFSPWTLNSQRVDLDFHGKAPEESFTLDPEQSNSQHRYSRESTRTCTSTVPYIDNLQGVSSKLQHLDLNTEQVHTSDMNSSLTMPSVISFGGIYDLSNALVPFDGRMVVPYERPLRLVKRKRPRAKVDLDFETTRVWNILMGNNAEPVDGTDIEKERWWQQEREVFQGRANSFIARMRLVQGDRRFSPWKGSVVDSVVGVFLTQNVADHLSSSAFMALAATFPSWSVSSSCKDTATQDNTQTSETECQRLKTVAINGDVFGKSETSGPMMPFCSTIDCQQLDLRNEENVSSTSPNSSSGSASPYLKGSKDEKANLLFTPCDSHVAERSSTKTATTVMYSRNTSTVLSVDHEKQTSFEASDGQENELCFVIDEMIAEPTRKDDECTLNSGFTSYDRVPDTKAQTSRPKKTKTTSKKNTENFDWDRLRRQVCREGSVKERNFERRDSVDWEAIRCADVQRISHAIRERGMNNILAERIQNFLNRLVRDHGSIDLEWLRDIPPDSAKDFLLSIRGLGLKSVECVRLLTLHHLAFPVDTNVGRICVRLGWVPIQPLPESLQLHLLELYPVLETIQKYLWPRLCKLDQHTLYELHYHMITFGKVFCTKSKPNCNACPLRSECKHFASAFASARLALPAPQEKSLVKSSNQFAFESSSMPPLISSHLPRLEGSLHIKDFIPKNSEPIIEEPASPREEECPETMENDIEDFVEDGEIPTIKLNMEAFAQNLENCIKESNKELQSDDIAKALVAIRNEAASIPLPKLKNVHRLRTEHYVYELPDSHPLVQQLELDQRELDDPSPYLLAIWTPGEVKEISNTPKSCCDSQVEGESCNNEMCHSCFAERQNQSRYVRGTILVPCRTAMRGSFPLNGTYFQVNEVFADHRSSHDPIHVERKHIWNLQRRMVLFGTSVPTIFKGLTTEEIQQCFWRGFVCVRGFDRDFRTPRPLCAHLHVVARPRSRKTAATEQVH